MGSRSHLKPGEFSRRFNSFLNRIVVAQGGESQTRKGEGAARWAETNITRTNGEMERGRDYWSKLFTGASSLTTEDIALVSGWLKVSPFEFLRAVREDDPSIVGVHVSGDDDTEPTPISREKERELRQQEIALAARRDQGKSRRK